jgi:hypothetical protein
MFPSRPDVGHEERKKKGEEEKRAMLSSDGVVVRTLHDKAPSSLASYLTRAFLRRTPPRHPELVRAVYECVYQHRHLKPKSNHKYGKRMIFLIFRRRAGADFAYSMECRGQQRLNRNH